MTQDHDPKKDVSANETAVLLDQIMRGEKVLLLPPGALVAGLLMVVLCFGIVGLVSMLGGVASMMGVTTDALLPLEFFGGVALILGPCVGQFLVILGYSEFGRRLLFYVRCLWMGTVLLIGASVAGWLEITWWMGVVALVCLGAAHQLLRSRSYAALISFFSLKREYRLNQKAASDRVLGRR